MPPHVRRGGARGRSNTPRHAAQARADLSAGRSAPRTQGKFAAFDEFCKRLRRLPFGQDFRHAVVALPRITLIITVFMGDNATVSVILSRSSSRTANPSVEKGSAGTS